MQDTRVGWRLLEAVVGEARSAFDDTFVGGRCHCFYWVTIVSRLTRLRC